MWDSKFFENDMVLRFLNHPPPPPARALKSPPQIHGVRCP